MRPNGIVTMVTDFGLEDGYVAAMKGVVLNICPAARLVDITHSVAAQDVAEAAFALASAWRYFPAGSVHLIVVDPGVGSERRAVAVSTGEHIFVAPDNGVVPMALGQQRLDQAVSLTRQGYWRTAEPSATFHGRDIFAPVAAHLAAGVPLEDVGEPIDDLMRLPDATFRIGADGTLLGTVVHVDHFGNLITNIPRSAVAGERERVRVRIGATTLSGLSHTYAAAAHGALLALIGSHGMVEIAVRDGSAADELGVGKGTAVTISA